MSLLQKHCHFQALNKNIWCKNLFERLDPFASLILSLKTRKHLYSGIPETSEYFSYTLHDPEKKNITRANILDECTVLPENFFQNHFPDEAPIQKKINTKVVNVWPIGIREPQQESIEVVFFRCRNIDRKAISFHETESKKERFYNGRSFKKVLYSRTLWVIKSYDIAFDGKIIPSFQTIADTIKIHRNTAIKYLQADREMGALDWDSGKKTYETNSYHLCDAYKELIIPRPKNITLPGKIHYAISGKIAKAKGWCKQKLLNHISRENVHHKLVVYLSLRTALDEMRKKATKTGVDPPKGKRGLSCWHLLKPFSFSGKDRAILSRFGEASLRPAIDDLEKYKFWGREVTNEIAFLISRCKKHKEKLITLNAAKTTKTPQEALEWTKEYLSANSKKLRFLRAGKTLNRNIAAENTSPIIDFKIHKESPRLSVLEIFQKVGGQWVDRSFMFSQPNVAEVILEYLEKSYAKPKRNQDQMKKAASPQKAKETLEWFKGFLGTIKEKVRFLSPGKSIVRNIEAKSTSPIIDLKIHSKDAEKSILRIHQRVNDDWVDKEYRFDHPALQKELTEHFKKALSM